MDRTGRARGYTLIEVIIAGALLVIVIGIALSLFVGVQRDVGGSLQLTEAAQAAGRLGSLLQQELRNVAQITLGSTGPSGFEAGGTALSPAGQFTSIQYRQVEGFDAAADPPAPIIGALHELRFAYDAGEAGLAGSGNGADDDNDGRVDEGTVVLYVDANADGAIGADERVAVLGVNVSSDDFAFSLASGLATPQATDRELRVAFTVLLRKAATGSADGTTGEVRRLSIPLRNRS